MKVRRDKLLLPGNGLDGWDKCGISGSVIIESMIISEGCSRYSLLPPKNWALLLL